MSTLTDDQLDNAFQEIAEAEAKVLGLQHRLLEKLGWTYTSNTPKSIWRWVKTLADGRILITGMADALDIEEGRFDF